MRIYTEAWDQLKVAGQELGAKNARELPHRPHDHARPKREKPSEVPVGKKGHKLTLITLAVFGVVSILSVTFWMGLHERLAIAGRDDPRTHLELLQGKVTSLEEERKRLANENAKLSTQNEQRALEIARLVEELETLRSQKEPASHRKQLTERPPEGAPKESQESIPVKQGPVKGSTERLEGSVQKAAKASAID